MRDLARRLAALETRSGNSGFRRVVILGPDDPSPPDSDDLHIVRIVGVKRDDDGRWILPHDEPAAVSRLVA